MLQLSELWGDKIEEHPDSWDVLNDLLLDSALCLAHVHAEQSLRLPQGWRVKSWMKCSSESSLEGSCLWLLCWIWGWPPSPTLTLKL